MDIRIKEHPNDIELSQAKALYSGKAAKFANLIAIAQSYENESSTSSHAIAWYLKAENLHPESKHTSAGIKRITSSKAKYSESEDDVNKKTKSATSEDN